MAVAVSQFELSLEDNSSVTIALVTSLLNVTLFSLFLQTMRWNMQKQHLHTNVLIFI